MNSYRVLRKQVFKSSDYALVPIRFEDRLVIMKWRNEQIYHLRQSKPLTEVEQNDYFNNVLFRLFDQPQPEQILFSFLEKGKCIGYGGLVHINWIDLNAEISFIIDTSLEADRFQELWKSFIKLIEEVAFLDLLFHKIYTYAFDLRPHLYETLINVGFFEDARLKEHAIFMGKGIDVLIHSKINQNIQLVLADENDVEITYKWASDNKIRQFSFNKGRILFEEHKMWFLGKLVDPNCHYFILKIGAEKVGSIRIDYKKESNIGLISYLIGSEFQRLGYGTRILQLLEENILTKFENIRLNGLVNKSNEASASIFRKLHYDLISDQNDVLTFSKLIKR